MLILRFLFSEVPNLGSIFINAFQQLLIGVIGFSAYISAEHFRRKHSRHIGIIKFTAVASGCQDHICKLGRLTGGLICQKDNGCSLFMYHLRSEIHQPGISGIGDKNCRIAFLKIAGKVEHILSVTSVIVYMGKGLPQDGIQKFSHTGRSS